MFTGCFPSCWCHCLPPHPHPPPDFHMSDVSHVCLSQTKMSAARTTAAASTSASTRSARTFVSAATVLYCMRTNMTVRKVGSTSTHTCTHTGTNPSAHTHTCCRIRTSMCSCTRAAIVPRTATLCSWPRPAGEAWFEFIFFIIYSALGGCRQSCPTGMCRKKSNTSLQFTLHRPPKKNPSTTANQSAAKPQGWSLSWSDRVTTHPAPTKPPQCRYSGHHSSLFTHQSEKTHIIF